MIKKPQNRSTLNSNFTNYDKLSVCIPFINSLNSNKLIDAFGSRYNQSNKWLLPAIISSETSLDWLSENNESFFRTSTSDSTKIFLNSNNTENDIEYDKGTIFFRFRIYSNLSIESATASVFSTSATSVNRLLVSHNFTLDKLLISLNGNEYSFDVIYDQIYNLAITWGENGFACYLALDGESLLLGEQSSSFFITDPLLQEANFVGDILIGSQRSVDCFCFYWWDEQLDTEELNEINTNPYIVISETNQENIIGPTMKTNSAREILAQTVETNDTMQISKVSINLSVNNIRRTNFIVGVNDEVSFSSANFQKSKDSWIFQPVVHWEEGNDWETFGLTISNTYQSEEFEIEELENAPYLEWDFYIDQSGVYNLWGYGNTEDGDVLWSLDEDITNLRNLSLGESNEIKWTNFGQAFLEGGLHKFRVYSMSSTRFSIDQFYFTSNINFSSRMTEIDQGSYLYSTSRYNLPLPLSRSPFMTAIRLRNLSENEIIPVDEHISGSESITSWLSSVDMIDSGQYNYEIKNNKVFYGGTFNDGVSIEFFQIGTNSDFHSSWNYTITDNFIGQSYRSLDFGRTYSILV